MTQETNVRVELPLEGIEAEVRVAFDWLLGRRTTGSGGRNTSGFTGRRTCRTSIDQP